MHVCIHTDLWMDYADYDVYIFIQKEVYLCIYKYVYINMYI
jgi:hypothetical protein